MGDGSLRRLARVRGVGFRLLRLTCRAADGAAQPEMTQGRGVKRLRRLRADLQSAPRSRSIAGAVRRVDFPRRGSALRPSLYILHCSMAATVRTILDLGSRPSEPAAFPGTIT